MRGGVIITRDPNIPAALNYLSKLLVLTNCQRCSQGSAVHGTPGNWALLPLVRSGTYWFVFNLSGLQNSRIERCDLGALAVP